MSERLSPQREALIGFCLVALPNEVGFEKAARLADRYEAAVRAESAAELAAVRAERDEALAAVERLKGQRSFLLKQIQKKGARSGEADAALRRFLSDDDEEARS